MELPKGATELSKDTRPIQVIVWPAFGNQRPLRLGHDGVTRIEAYDENGELAAVPWVAVFKGDDLVLRTAARHVFVSYEPEQPT